MNALLQVENEKGVEVLFNPPIEVCYPSQELPRDSSTESRKLVIISSYTKDENILNSSMARMRTQISSVPKGFCQYLFDRKKAGVIKYSFHSSKTDQSNIILYVLPPKNREDTHLSCISATASESASCAVSRSLCQNASSSSSSSISATSSSASVPKNVPTVSGGVSKNVPPAPALKGDDFFSGLLNKVSTMSTSFSYGRYGGDDCVSTRLVITYCCDTFV